MAGLLEFLKGIKPQGEEREVAEVGGQPVKVIEVGSSGTEIYGGYLSEEYLSDLRGTRWAEKIDQMRRSDANVRMAINALKLPLKSSNWYINEKEKSEEAELQKKLMEKALFEDTGRSFTKLIGEILTCLDFGYSLFEITYKPKLNDPELGHYNTLKSIAYRSQKTIESWNVTPDGSVKSVLQLANGDTGRSVNLDARFLLHFAPEQEGDNFEGVSVLRGMYGSWLRKNHFLKLMAAGIEKYAIPIPILEVPEGKENSPEYKNAIKALQKFTSNQSNYITFPQGWKLDIKTTVFEAEKIRNTIEFENKEMVNSILASFLLLGQGSSGGAYALSKDLSDFFSQTLNYVADHIAEQFEEKIFKPLIKMNFGDRPCLVELRCDGLNEKADKVWADTLSVLTEGGIVTKDGKLEEFVREKFKLPKIDAETQYQSQGTTPQNPEPTKPTQLAEKKKTKQRETVKLIRDTASQLSSVFDSYLRVLGTKYIEDMIRQKGKANSSNEIKAANKVDILVPSDYLEGVRAILAMASLEARDDVKALFPKPKRLSEFRLATDRTKQISDKKARFQKATDEMLAASSAYVADPSNPELKEALSMAREKFKNAASAARNSIEVYLPAFEVQKNGAKADLLLDSQVSDLKKSLGLQYQTSLPSTDSDQVIRKDLQDRLETTVSGPLTYTGPDILASQTINESRLDEAKESGGDEVESYTFIGVDDDRQSEICAELSGRTFASNDPDLERYTPPLHHNCRSYLAVNLRSFKGNPEIDSEKLELSKAAQKSITLSEGCCPEESLTDVDRYILDLQSRLKGVKFKQDETD